MTDSAAIRAWIRARPRAFGSLRLAASAAISAALTIAFVVPVLHRIDLIPAPYLLHPFFMKVRFPVPLAVQLFDALLAWLWGIRALVAIARRGGRRLFGPSERPRRRRLQRAATWALVVATIPPALLAIAANRSDVPRESAAAYTHACSRCHSERRALSFLRSREAWALTIERHRRFAPQAFTDAEAVAALAYLTAKRSATGATLFWMRCLVCHSEGDIREPRELADWQGIVGRTARFNPFALSPMEAREILAYIATSPLAAPARPPNEKDSAERRRYEAACGQCHTLDVALLPGIEDDRWPGILGRMARKAPSVISEEEARRLAPWILAVRRDPERLRHLLPHHSSKPFFGGVFR